MDIADFHFIRPWWLLALIPAIILFVVVLRQKLSQGNWSDICDAELMPFILQQKPNSQSRIPLLLGSLGVLLTIIALAGPTWQRLPAPAFRNDAALVIVLDLSSSMDAADVKPSRVARARFKINDILQQRKDGQTALLVFAEAAFTVTPLTTDTETIISQVKALKTEIMPTQGKNTLEALQLASQLLQQAGLQQGHILLISDAVNTHTIENIASTLGPYHLSILGIGTPEGAPVRAAKGGFMKDLNGNMILPKLEASQLRALAAAGGGRYVTFSSDDSDTKKLSAFFDDPSIQKSETDHELYLDNWVEQGPWLLLLILPLAALSFRKGLLVFLPILMFHPLESHAFGWQDLWLTQDQQAQQAFSQQQFDAAAEQFASSQWKAAALYKAGKYQQAAELLSKLDTPQAHYNRGNALAKAGQFQQALDAYQQTLNHSPDHKDATYNKKLIEQHLQQQEQEQEKNQQPPPSDNQQSQDQKQDTDQKDPSSQDSQQNPQQNPESQQSDENQHAHDEQHQQAQQNAEQNESETNNEAQQVAESQEQQPSNDAADQHAQPQQMTEQPASEEELQAAEQWLKRVKDNPSGLLKRKFKYQYGRRNQ